MAPNSQSPLSNRRRNAEPTNVDSSPVSIEINPMTKSGGDAAANATKIYDSDHTYHHAYGQPETTV